VSFEYINFYKGLLLGFVMEQTGEQRKRNVAYKVTIGEILRSKPIHMDDRLIHVELGNKQIVRVNILANCIDKFISESQEKRYASLTVDDASGQIRLKVFSDDVPKVEPVLQGDTLQIIAQVRFWNDELYLQPEILKKVDPRWLLVRKLEIGKIREATPVTASEGNSQSAQKGNNAPVRDEIMRKIKDAEVNGGVDVDELIMGSDASPDIVNGAVKKLLEEGLIYEPRPGRLRYLG